MSYDPRLTARAYGAPGADDDGDAKKGSVRAARERLQVEQMHTQLPDTSKIIGLPQRPNQLLSQYSSQKRAEQPQLSIPSDDREDGDRASPSPQWPLPNNTNDIPEFSPIASPRSPERLQEPPSIRRPVSDDLPIQQLSPGYPSPTSPNHLQLPISAYGESYTDDGLLSPSSFRFPRPLTTSSAASQRSSLGSIPDFPLPQHPMPSIQQARRVPSLGPPPSARRGPSSYYTQMSYVSPIVEESESRSATTRSRHGSYASSNVFPTNVDDFYPDDDPLSDDETITSDRGAISPDHDDRSGLVQQSPALVRQASLGRRTKPSLMTIKSSDSFGDKKGSIFKKKSSGVGASASALGAENARDDIAQGPPRSSLSNGTGPSTSSSESVDTLRDLTSKARDYAGSGPFPHPLQQETRPATLAERAGMRRPPRLDIDAVRDAEARGSLTSLPELIRRATRLAANLDRGRTASRMGVDFWENGTLERNDVRQSGLSDMLAAFPPPGVATPLRSGTPNAASNMSKWPPVGSRTRAGVTDSGLSNEKPEKRRKCCGMPMWTFITLLLVLLLIIAAAVVIPVVLVVIPNQNKSNDSTSQESQGSGGNNNNGNTSPSFIPAPTASPGNDQCEGLVTCQNGGVAILNSDRSCNCVCINGFTGRTCTNNDATGCTTTSVAGTAKNATLGSGIPRLIESAADSFKVPLDATRILSLFSSLSLSCAAENALITFNGLASRSVSRHLQSINLRTALHPTRSFPLLHHPHPAQPVGQPRRRQTVGEADETEGTEASNGRDAAQYGTIKTQPISSNVNALDFARVGVLLALQETGDLDIAASAQEAIQDFLTNNRNGNTASDCLDVGPFEMNLVDFTIQYRNGTTIRASS